MRSTSLASNSNGQIMNLISNDCARVESSILYLPFLIVVPAEVIFAVILLYNCVDKAILSGLLIITVAILFQTILARIYNRMRYTSIINYTYL